MRPKRKPRTSVRGGCHYLLNEAPRAYARGIQAEFFRSQTKYNPPSLPPSLKLRKVKKASEGFSSPSSTGLRM